MSSTKLYFRHSFPFFLCAKLRAFKSIVPDVVVFFLSLDRSFETVSLHSTSPPLSLCNGGAEVLFEGREDHPRLRGPRPGKGNVCRFNWGGQDGFLTQAISWKASILVTRGSECSIMEVWAICCVVAKGETDFRTFFPEMFEDQVLEISFLLKICWEVQKEKPLSQLC